MKPRYFARALTAIILLSMLLSTMAACDKLPTGKQPTPTEKLIQLPTKTATATTDATPTKPQTAGGGGTQAAATVAATRTNTPTPQPPGKLGDLTKVKILDTKTQDMGPGGGSVSLKDEVTVVVPSGAVDATAKMTINKLDLSDLAAATRNQQTQGFGELAGYDVTIGNQHEFKKPLTIQIAYDPTKIVSDYPPEKALIAAWWDTEQNVWHTAPVLVDTQRKVVSITTDHLTPWKLVWLIKGYTIAETDHFVIVYNPKATVKVALEKGVVGTGEQDAFDFAQRVGVYLEQAYKKYMALGFKDPRWSLENLQQAGEGAYIQGTPVAGSKPGFWPVPKVYVIIGSGAEVSTTRSLKGDITLANNFDSMDRVKHETAHELFHAVEQMYFTVYGYGARQWWLEACADYAADRIGWGGLNSMDKVRLAYFAAPINTVDTHHEYETALFIDYLMGKGVAFKGLFDEVAAGWTQIIGSFETHVKNKTTTSLHDHYKNWAAYVLFDASSPLEELKTGLSAGTINEGPRTMPANTEQLSYTFNLKGNYTARLWGFKASPKDDPKNPRALIIEATGNVPTAADVEANVYVLKNDQRAAGGVASKGTINSANKSLKLSLAADETAYILAVNTGGSDQSLALKVSDDKTGTWVLVGRTEKLDPATAVAGTSSVMAKSATISGNSAALVLGTFKWAGNWPEPPAKLTPGQKLTGTLSVKDAGSNQATSYLGRGNLRFTLNPPWAGYSIGSSSSSPDVSVSAQVPLGHPEASPGLSTSGSRDFSWEIPGPPNKQMTITMTFAASLRGSDGTIVMVSSSATVEYKYELRP